MNKCCGILTPKLHYLTFPYLIVLWVTGDDVNAPRYVWNSAIFCVGGEYQHHQTFIMKNTWVTSVHVGNRGQCQWRRLFSLIWKGEKCNYKHLNIPEHVGNGASHFPFSKHVSSPRPSSTKPLMHSNCNLCPIFIFPFSRGSPHARRKLCISSASQVMSGR